MASTSGCPRSTTCATSRSCTASAARAEGEDRRAARAGRAHGTRARAGGGLLPRDAAAAPHRARAAARPGGALPRRAVDRHRPGRRPRAARDHRGRWSTVGKTVLLTTHYMFEADELCDRIAVIRAGEIVAEGTPEQLKRLVTVGSVVEIETYGVADAAVADLGAIAGVQSVAVEEQGQMQVLILHCDADAQVTQAALAAAATESGSGGVGTREPTLEDAYVELVSDREAVLRQQWSCYRLQLKVISTSWFDGALAVFFPLMFATATLLIYGCGTTRRRCSSPASVPRSWAMWTCQGVIASSLLTRERWAGTLELRRRRADVAGQGAGPDDAGVVDHRPLHRGRHDALGALGLRARAPDRELAAVHVERPGRCAHPGPVRVLPRRHRGPVPRVVVARAPRSSTPGGCCAAS